MQTQAYEQKARSYRKNDETSAQHTAVSTILSETNNVRANRHTPKDEMHLLVVVHPYACHRPLVPSLIANDVAKRTAQVAYGQTSPFS